MRGMRATGRTKRSTKREVYNFFITNAEMVAWLLAGYQQLTIIL